MFEIKNGKTKTNGTELLIKTKNLLKLRWCNGDNSEKMVCNLIRTWLTLAGV